MENSWPCVFCGAADAGRDLYATSSTDGTPYRLRRCDRCEAVMLTPPPSAEVLAEAYDVSYYGARSRKFGVVVAKLVASGHASTARRVASRVGGRGRCLDVGCGDGEFLRRLIELGFEAHGVELAGPAAERAARVPGLQLKVGTLQDDDYAPASFDAITLWHVYEHLSDPRESLGRFARLLKPGGHLFLSLPNIESLQARLFRGAWFHLDPPRHLCFLGPEALTRHLGELRFRKVGQSFFSLSQNPYGFQQSLLNALLDRRDVLYDAFKGSRERVSAGSLLAQRIFFVLSLPPAVVAAAIEAVAGRGGTMELVFRKEAG